MRTEHARILIECLARQNAIAATPEPASWEWWNVREHRDCLTYGPRYEPAKWFGGLTNAQRQRYMRAVYDLDAEGLLLAFKSEGNRLQRVKLTEAGLARAAKLEAPVDAP